jgi:hypothetical protein
MAHRNARLTEFGRLLLVQRVTELDWRPALAAESLGVSRATAYKWLGRYRAEGPAGLAERSSQPAAARMPCRSATSAGCWRPAGGVVKARTGWRGGWGCNARRCTGCCAAMA